MSLPPFEFFSPTTIAEALSLMAERGGKLQVLAGGTELMGRLKHGLINPSCVMSLKRVRSLVGIKNKTHTLVIGAGTTVRELAESGLIPDSLKAVSQAALLVAAPPVRNLATVGGNLLQNSRCLYYNQSALVRGGLGPCFKLGGAICHAVKGGKRCFSVYQGDLAPALIAVGAKAKLQNRGSSRTIPVEELFTGKGKAPFALAGGELLTEIVLPIPVKPSFSAYQKFRLRGSIDYPLASTAVFFSTGEKGTIDSARIVVGAAGPAPKILAEAAGAVISRKAQDVDVEQVGTFAAKAMEAVSNMSLPGPYRRKITAVLTRRALQEALIDLTQVGNA
jgi:4-hydroxybenzoyl-CoA reductase subunit beta